MMKLSVVAALFAVLVSTAPALAIINGVPDGNAHPYVGVAIFSVNGVPTRLCSGSLISPNVFLTAGHCTAGATSANVWFESSLVPGQPPANFPFGGPGSTAHAGTVVTHPDFCFGCGKGLVGANSFDLGLILLAQPVSGITPAALPTLNLSASLRGGTPVTSVGYGVQEWLTGTGTGVEPSTRWSNDGRRYQAKSELLTTGGKLSAEFLKVSANSGQGRGGICFGDSGGPTLLGETNTILGITSFFVNETCSGITYSQRIDTTPVLSWIQGYLQAP